MNKTQYAYPLQKKGGNWATKILSGTYEVRELTADGSETYW